jgi:hypothetical protein
MSGDFLIDDQIQNYGCYVAEPNEVQLAKYVHLDERDLDFVNQRRGRHNRFGGLALLFSPPPPVFWARF